MIKRKPFADLTCPSCRAQNFGRVLKDDKEGKTMLYCFDCHTAWTVRHVIEDIVDPQERI